MKRLQPAVLGLLLLTSLLAGPARADEEASTVSLPWKEFRELLALDEPPPLSPGSPADFVVLDRDPVTARPDELRGAQVLDTWVGGHPIDVPDGAELWAG